MSIPWRPVGKPKVRTSTHPTNIWTHRAHPLSVRPSEYPSVLGKQADIIEWYIYALFVESGMSECVCAVNNDVMIRIHMFLDLTNTQTPYQLWIRELLHSLNKRQPPLLEATTNTHTYTLGHPSDTRPKKRTKMYTVCGLCIMY